MKKIILIFLLVISITLFYNNLNIEMIDIQKKTNILNKHRGFDNKLQVSKKLVDKHEVLELADLFEIPSVEPTIEEDLKIETNISEVLVSPTLNLDSPDLKKGKIEKVSINNLEAPFISDIIKQLKGEDKKEKNKSKEPDEKLLPLVSGQARGYAMLYLMHPNARATVEKQVEALIKANLAEVYLSVLTDGTFQRDFLYLANVIKRISARSKLKLVLYLTNGPSQRNYENLSIDAGVNSISPETFNYLISYDETTQKEYQNLILPNYRIIELNNRLGNSTIVIPMLEDNVDSEAFSVMSDLTFEALGSNFEIRRNPCGCKYDDNGRTTENIEKHKLEDISDLISGDGYVLDGVGYSLDPNGVQSLRKNLDQTKSLDYFGLWRFQRQGFYTKEVTQHPDDRIYEIPSNADLEIEVDILRYGLTPVS